VESTEHRTKNGLRDNSTVKQIEYYIFANAHPGTAHSNKLCIQVLEADVSQVLQIVFAHKIAHLATKHGGNVSYDQYGRAHKTCVTPVLYMLLTVQLLIQWKTKWVLFDNDTKWYYDRIISSIALTSLKYIVYLYSTTLVHMLVLFWAQLDHHVCTGYGISDTTYSSMLKILLYGICSAAASPILWSLLNQLLLAALDENYYFILAAVDGIEDHIQPGDSLIDYTTCSLTNDYPNAAYATPNDENMVHNEADPVMPGPDLFPRFTIIQKP
jgi:hypothetical protein